MPVGTAIARRAPERGREVLINSAQLNQRLAQLFDSAPLADYALAPRAQISEADFRLRLAIYAKNLPAGSPAQTVTLFVSLRFVGGLLEILPTGLAYDKNLISTQQVKRSEALVVLALDALVREGLGLAPDSPFFYLAASQRADMLILTVVGSGE
jgi:hypothetical protein